LVIPRKERSGTPWLEKTENRLGKKVSVQIQRPSKKAAGSRWVPIKRKKRGPTRTTNQEKSQRHKDDGTGKEHANRNEKKQQSERKNELNRAAPKSRKTGVGP